MTVRSDAYRISEETDSHLLKTYLRFDQGKADTKMFFCATFALTLDFNLVCIVTEDTDVLVLVCYYSGKFSLNC